MKTLYTLIFLHLSVFVFSQTNPKINLKPYVVAEISGLNKFEKMNKEELKLDSSSKEGIKLLDSMIKVDNIFEPSYQLKATQEEKQETIERMRAETPDFGQNRSRYYFQYYKNNKIDSNALKGIDDYELNTPCECLVSNDTIQVRMGIWIFGGFAFTIDIVGNKFNSQYSDDKHDRKVYKLKLSDTLGYEINVNNNIQELTLQSKPNFNVGQNIIGYLNFQTDKYYCSNDEDYYGIKVKYNDKNMDMIYLKGNLYFKCKVRKKLKTD